MTTLYMTAGGVALIVAIGAAVVYFAKKAERERIRKWLAEEAARRARAFEEKMSEPLPRGDDAIDRLP